ncbi:MerR family DNA-binding transcriptional regulator [Achromobacter sp. F4_2707]|uniref:MerR family transcriptional regulator n=1 Tax=Achromobacter sp. F4_2707 TaxID=3114286 RepID=UPI0039C71B0F
MSQQSWTISELAKEFGITPRTIRFYEDQGIVSPERLGRNRVYYSRDRTRLKLALRGKRMGFQLSEILDLINMYDATRDNTSAQLQHYVDVLEKHRVTLEQQRNDLEQTLREIEYQLAHCRDLLKQQA